MTKHPLHPTPARANAPGLPASRRGFLHGLVSLPLIGGGIGLIGAPTAVAEPTSRQLLDSYDAWLLYERCHLKAERFGRSHYWDALPDLEEGLTLALGVIPVANQGAKHHFSNRAILPPPSSRAALVLSAVGCNWREGGR